MNSNWEMEVAKAEERLRNAMIESDIPILDKLLSPCLVFTNHLGLVMSKSDDIEGHKAGDLKIEDIVLSDQIIKRIDGLVLVSVHAEITGSYKGSTANGNFRFTRLWNNENSNWKVIVGHSCLVA